MTKKQIISELAKRCLTEKWCAKSMSTVFSLCAFCKNTKERCERFYPDLVDKRSACSKCLCPKEICDKGGHGGFIGSLAIIYLPIFPIKNITHNDLIAIRALFQKYIIEEEEENND